MRMALVGMRSPVGQMMLNEVKAPLLGRAICQIDSANTREHHL